MTGLSGLLIGILAVWRVTYLLNAEDGPADVLARLRRRLGHGGAARLVTCFYCLSVWVAIPAAWFLGADWPHRLLLWPALSGGAILVEELMAGRRAVTVRYYEEREPGS